MSIISNEHQSGSPFECPGCFRARGECECQPRPEHQPGSPGAVDLDELDRLHSENLNLLDFDLAMHRRWPAIVAELRTLRARVAELENKLRGATHAVQDASATRAESETVDDRVSELEAIACAAIVVVDAAPARVTWTMWTRLFAFLNDRVRRSLVDAMKRQGLPFKEHPGGEWRSWEEP